MSRTRNSALWPAAAGLSLLAGGTVGAQTTVPLNTGYNHAVYGVYPNPASPSTTADNYWINVSSYPATTPAAGPAWVITTASPWAAPFPSSRWISARNTPASAPHTDPKHASYTIFRKCFCLLPNFTDPRLSFQVRADNHVQAWFNSAANVVLAFGNGNFNGMPRQSLPSSPGWFHAGTNCLYVLVDDVGVLMGLDLQGTIQANGLLPLPATGVNPTFTCPCERAVGRPAEASELDRTLAEIVRIVEEQRRSRGVAAPAP